MKRYGPGSIFFDIEPQDEQEEVAASNPSKRARRDQHPGLALPLPFAPVEVRQNVLTQCFEDLIRLTPDENVVINPEKLQALVHFLKCCPLHDLNFKQRLTSGCYQGQTLEWTILGMAANGQPAPLEILISKIEASSIDLNTYPLDGPFQGQTGWLLLSLVAETAPQLFIKIWSKIKLPPLTPVEPSMLYFLTRAAIRNPELRSLIDDLRLYIPDLYNSATLASKNPFTFQSIGDLFIESGDEWGITLFLSVRLDNLKFEPRRSVMPPLRALPGLMLSEVPQPTFPLYSSQYKLLQNFLQAYQSQDIFLIKQELMRKTNGHALLWYFVQAAIHHQIFRNLIEKLMSDDFTCFLFSAEMLHETSNGSRSMQQLLQECPDGWGRHILALIEKNQFIQLQRVMEGVNISDLEPTPAMASINEGSEGDVDSDRMDLDLPFDFETEPDDQLEHTERAHKPKHPRGP
ncbi:MAG: hypothetical protein ACHQJ6_02625 [Candidatus Berkiellales bacterium]